MTVEGQNIVLPYKSLYKSFSNINSCPVPGSMQALTGFLTELAYLAPSILSTLTCLPVTAKDIGPQIL